MNNQPGGSIGSSDGSHSLEPSHPPEDDDDEGGIPHNLSDPQLAPQDEDEPQGDDIMEEDAAMGAAMDMPPTVHDINNAQTLNNSPIENSGTSQQPSTNTTQLRPISTSIKDSKLTIQLPSTLPSTLPSSSSGHQQNNSSSYTDTVINGESMNNLAMNSPSIKTQLLPQIQEGGVVGQSMGGIGMLPSTGGRGEQLSTGRGSQQTSGEKSIEISSRSNHTLVSQGRVNRTVDEVREMMGPYRANTPGDMSLSSEISSSTAITQQQHQTQQQPTGTTVSTGRYGSPAIEGISISKTTSISAATNGGIKTQEDNTPGGREATAAHERRQSGKLSPRAQSTSDNRARRGMITSNIRGPNMTLERLSYILGRGSLIMVSF